VATASNLGLGLFKRNLYLQRAFIEGKPTDNVTLWAGRFENPFWTSELLYDNDVLFDGVAAEVRFPHRLFGALDWTLRGGLSRSTLAARTSPIPPRPSSTPPRSGSLRARSRPTCISPGGPSFRSPPVGTSSSISRGARPIRVRSTSA